jgi:ribosome maturation factor RimP
MSINTEALITQLSPVIEGLGFKLVELSYGNLKGSHQVQIALYHEAGIGSDECAITYQTILPRLEILLNTRNIHLEIGSPGLERKIKSNREYSIFIGKHVKLLLKDQNRIHGTIVSADENSVTIKIDDENCSIPFADIVKGKLEYTWEVK